MGTDRDTLAVQAELVGNRATEANFWAVVCATEAAFPLLLGASLDQARQTAASVGAGGNANLVRDLWILQVMTSAHSQIFGNPMLYTGGVGKAFIRPHSRRASQNPVV